MARELTLIARAARLEAVLAHKGALVLPLVRHESFESPALRLPARLPASAPGLVSGGWAFASLPRQALARWHAIALAPRRAAIEVSRFGSDPAPAWTPRHHRACISALLALTTAPHSWLAPSPNPEPTLTPPQLDERGGAGRGHCAASEPHRSVRRSDSDKLLEALRGNEDAVLRERANEVACSAESAYVTA